MTSVEEVDLSFDEHVVPLSETTNNTILLEHAYSEDQEKKHLKNVSLEISSSSSSSNDETNEENVTNIEELAVEPQPEPKPPEPEPKDDQVQIKSRELRQLLEAAKESNLDTNIVHKRRSIEPSNINKEESAGKRAMRSQNPDFVARHKKFLNKVSKFEMTPEGDQEMDVQNIKSEKDGSCLTKTPKRRKENFDDDSVGGSSVEDGKRSKKALKLDILNISMKKDKDSFCWRCHRDGILVQCETCPRGFHPRCLKQPVYNPDRWPCPECLAILQAESTKTRSPALRDMSLEHLCVLLKYAAKRMMNCQGSEPFIHPVDLKIFPDYQNYVVQPMDLTTLQNNIRNNVYGSTVAFMADAKWILHNSIIFNSYQSKLTSAAKSIVKICKQEMSEIETCSECYQKANTKKNSWFVEVCSKPHILLWAKLKGFPYWPAKAMTTNSAGLVDVRFFGAHDRAWIPIKDCFLYSQKDPNTTNKAKNNIAECVKEVNIHIEKLKEVFGEFYHAPYRTPYDPATESEQLSFMLPKYVPDLKSPLSSQKSIKSEKLYDDSKNRSRRGKTPTRSRSRSRARSRSRPPSETRSDVETSSSKTSLVNEEKPEKLNLKLTAEDFDKFMEGYGTEEDEPLRLNNEARKKIIAYDSESEDETPLKEISESVKNGNNEHEEDDEENLSESALLSRGKVRTRGGYHNITGKVKIIGRKRSLTSSPTLMESPSKLSRRNSDMSTKSDSSRISSISDKINRVEEFSDMLEVSLGNSSKDATSSSEISPPEKKPRPELMNKADLGKLKPIIQVNTGDLYAKNKEFRISPQSKFLSITDQLMKKITESELSSEVKKIESVKKQILDSLESSSSAENNKDIQNNEDVSSSDSSDVKKVEIEEPTSEIKENEVNKDTLKDEEKLVSLENSNINQNVVSSTEPTSSEIEMPVKTTDLTQEIKKSEEKTDESLKKSTEIKKSEEKSDESRRKSTETREHKRREDKSVELRRKSTDIKEMKQKINENVAEKNDTNKSLLESSIKDKDKNKSLLESSIKDKDKNKSLLESSLKEKDKNKSLLESSLKEKPRNQSLLESSLKGKETDLLESSLKEKSKEISNEKLQKEKESENRQKERESSRNKVVKESTKNKTDKEKESLVSKPEKDKQLSKDNEVSKHKAEKESEKSGDKKKNENDKSVKGNETSKSRSGKENETSKNKLEKEIDTPKNKLDKTSELSKSKPEINKEENKESSKDNAVKEIETKSPTKSVKSVPKPPIKRKPVKKQDDDSMYCDDTDEDESDESFSSSYEEDEDEEESEEDITPPPSVKNNKSHVKIVNVSDIISGKIENASEKSKKEALANKPKPKESNIVTESIDIKDEPISGDEAMEVDSNTKDKYDVTLTVVDKQKQPEKTPSGFKITDNMSRIIDSVASNFSKDFDKISKPSSVTLNRKEITLKPISKLMMSPKQKARKSFPNSPHKMQVPVIKKISEKKEILPKPTQNVSVKVVPTLQSISTSSTVSTTTVTTADATKIIATTTNTTKENMVYLTSQPSSMSLLPPNQQITLTQNSILAMVNPPSLIFQNPLTSTITTPSSSQSTAVPTNRDTCTSTTSLLFQPQASEQISQPIVNDGSLPESISKAVGDLLCKPPPKLKPRPPGPLSEHYDEGAPSSAGPTTTLINSISHRLTDYFRGLLKETLSDLTSIGDPESKIRSLELELETVKHKHAEEMLELRKNISSILKDIQKSIVEERAKVVDETRAACEAERLRSVEEAKSKQWCAFCLKEAQFYCCWNTSYCDYPCQQKHWNTHMKTCSQTARNATTGAVVNTTTTNSLTKAKQTYSNPNKTVLKSARMIVKQTNKQGVPMYLPVQRSAMQGQGTITLVESTPGNFEILGNHGPISLGGKLVPPTTIKVKPGNLITVSSTTANNSHSPSATGSGSQKTIIVSQKQSQSIMNKPANENKT